MNAWKLECLACGKAAAPDRLLWRCTCGGVLDIVTEPPKSFRTDLLNEESLWRYRATIPVGDDSAIVTLGEGLTPVIELDWDGETVAFKLEYRAPTGSFKDRGASVLLSRLKELGVREILEDSSGNAGCSIAAYAAAAGIQCRVLVPEEVTDQKAVQIASYGATLERVAGSRDDVAAEAVRRSEKIFYASHAWQPFFLQGTKTFAYEVFEQSDSMPEAIFFPTGNGSLLLGSFKGFGELLAARLIERMPRLISVQSVSYRPVYAGLLDSDSERDGWSSAPTIAKGIAVRAPARLKQIVEAVRRSGGTAVAVTDDEIRHAQKLLARRGLLVEPTSAAVVAGYLAWKRERGDEPLKVLMPLTGSGVKDLASFEHLSGPR